MDKRDDSNSSEEPRGLGTTNVMTKDVGEVCMPMSDSRTARDGIFLEHATSSSLDGFCFVREINIGGPDVSGYEPTNGGMLRGQGTDANQCKLHRARGESPTTIDTTDSPPSSVHDELCHIPGYVMNIYDPLAQTPNPFARHAVAMSTEPEFVMAPLIASQAVPLSKITETKKTKKSLDEIEEISPAGPDDGTKPATSSLYPCYDLWGIEEDAAMARRLATQEEAKYWPAEIFDKGDLEKGDAEFARNLYMLQFDKKPADVCPKPSKKCYFVVTLIVCTTIAVIVLMAMYIPKSSGDGCGFLEFTDNEPDTIRRRCLTSAGTTSSPIEHQEIAHTE